MNNTGNHLSDNNGRVIITSSRNIMALAIARSLGSKGIEVIGADCIGMTLTAMSKYTSHHEIYTDYEEDEAAFLNDLEKIILKYKPKDGKNFVLFPVFKETRIIAKHRKRFDKIITVASPTLEMIRQVYPKNNFALSVQKFNVPSPDTWLPESREDLDKIPDEAAFPILSKPYEGSGGRGIQKISGPEEMQQAFDSTKSDFGQPPLFQAMAEGEEYCMTAIYQDGEMKAAMAYRNIYQFPDEHGSGIMRVSVDEAPFRESTDKLLSSIKWNGVAQLDFLWTGKEEDEPLMIEVNPRFWAGLFQSIESGIDYPWLNYLLFTGQDLPRQDKPIIGVKTKLPLAWVVSALKESINLGESLDLIGKEGEKALKMIREQGNFTKALNSFIEGITENQDDNLKQKTIKKQWQEARNAENEIFSQDDPGASLGLAYSLLYFVKYGKLPPETGL